MNYQPKLYKEFVDEAEARVTAVAIRGKEAVINWLYAGKLQLGKANSTDGLHYDGTYAEVAHPSAEHGRFQFELYPLVSGGQILLGSWYSEINGDEREFLLVLEPLSSS